MLCYIPLCHGMLYDIYSEQNMLYNMCHVMLCNKCNVLLYDICSEQNRTCYITCVILCYMIYVQDRTCYILCYVTCHVMLYNVCHVMLYTIVMLCYIPLSCYVQNRTEHVI